MLADNMLYEYLLLSQHLYTYKMSFENRMEEACNGKEVPGVVLVADGPGKVHYQRAFGWCSIKGTGLELPLKADATFALASCTKLMTTVAALQCVERGLITLDEDVTQILPELRNIEILTGLDQRTRKPIFVRRRNQLTLRHLLTHTSGISHPAWNSFLYEYLSSQARPVSLSHTGRIVNTCIYPLVFEPGTSWEYGAGLDWAGKMVERLNGNISLQQYMATNIWTSLNMTTATFRLNERPDLEERLPDMMFRQGLNHPIYGTTMSPSGRVVPATDDEKEKPPVVEELYDEYLEDGNINNRSDDDFGGNGAYCSAPDFAKVLSSLCNNDHKLLHPSIVNEMFQPQLSTEARRRLQNFFAIKQINDIFAGGLPQTSPSLPLDWGLGGMLVMEDVPSDLGLAGNRLCVRRSKGSMFWAGLPNLYWWMDRQAGVSGVYASQLLPQGDPRSGELFAEFERWVYERADLGVKEDRMDISASL